jgi:hypothetical protein
MIYLDKSFILSLLEQIKMDSPGKQIGLYIQSREYHVELRKMFDKIVHREILEMNRTSPYLSENGWDSPKEIEPLAADGVLSLIEDALGRLDLTNMIYEILVDVIKKGTNEPKKLYFSIKNSKDTYSYMTSTYFNAGGYGQNILESLFQDLFENTFVEFRNACSRKKSRNK